MEKSDSKKDNKRKDKKVVLVTGATSYLGIKVVQMLVLAGHEVRVTIMEFTKTTNDWKLLPPGVKPYVTDLTLKTEKDKEGLDEACRDVDVVYHLAGATFNADHSYDKLINTNVIGTENLLNAYIESNKGRAKKLRFIFTSSISVYGYDRGGEKLDEDAITKPVSNYSRSKLMAEQVIHAFAEVNSNLKYTILRLSTLYGDGYTPSFFKIFRMIKAGKMRYVGGGNNHLTLLHVDDAARAVIESSESANAENRIYNLSDGAAYTLRSLLERAAQLLGVKPPTKNINKVVARMGRSLMGINYDEFEFISSDRVVSIDRIAKEVGFVPSVDIKDGAREMVSAFIARGG